MKIEFDGRRLTVHLRRRSVGDATRSIELNESLPPDGYKWVRAVIKRRGSSGRAVNVELQFAHCDRRVDALDEEGVRELFSDHWEQDPSASPLDT